MSRAEQSRAGFHSTLILGLATMAMVGSSSAQAQTLVSSQQLAASRPLAGDANRVRVWAVRDDDHLASVWQDSGNNWHWTDHGLAPSPPLPQLASVSYELGADHHERVWFVGVDGKLHELDYVNNTNGTWTSYSPPSGWTFTGNLAAMKGTWFGTQYVTVGLTTTDGTLWRAVGYAGDNALYYASSGVGYDTASQITATVSPTELLWTVFARKSDGTAGFFRWTGSGWITGNAGAPSDVDVGWSLTASQGVLSSSTYGLHLWTTSDVLENRIRVAVASSASSTSFLWTHTNTSGTPVGLFGLAATSRGNGSFSALDGVVHTLDDHLYRDTRTGTSWPWNAADLGSGLEMESNGGDSVTALGTDFGYSRVAWLGKMGGASHLYSRMGNGGPDELWRYEAHGDGLPRRRIDPGSVPHTEVMMDDWRGSAIAAAMVRPDNGDPNPNDDFSYVQAMWSDDDGETWGAPVTMPSTAEGLSYNYQADPTVAFTDTGKAYVTWMNVQFPGDFDLGNIDRQAVVFTTTTDGSPDPPPTVVASGDGTPVMDHPWMDIDRTRSPNRLHFIWWDGWPGGPTMYRCLDDDTTCPSTSTDCCQAPCSTPPCLGPTRDLSTEWGLAGGPPTLSVGGDGGAYAAWSPDGQGVLQVCRLESDLARCEIAPSSLTGPWAMDTTRVEFTVPGEPDEYLVAAQGWSIAAAQNPDCPQECPACGVLYYAFQRTESGASTKDVYASRGVYCRTSPSWSWSDPVKVPTVTEDGTDQFSPVVTVLADGGQGRDDHVFVSWYDRRDPCQVTTIPNRCLRLKGAIASIFFTSFVQEHDIQIGPATDPHLLPYHPGDPENRRFIGDFREHAGNLLHSHYMWSAAPETGGPGTAELWQSFVAGGHHVY